MLVILRSEGDSWKNACNTCRCGPNGLAFCTQIFCAAIFAEDTKGNINIHTSTYDYQGNLDKSNIYSVKPVVYLEMINGT